MLNQWWGALLDLVYPPKCPVCRSRVDCHGAWCQKCMTGIIAPREINLLIHHLGALDGCQAVCAYTGGIKRLIHDMKFRHAGNRAVYLTWLLEQSGGWQLPKEIELVIPVPLHDKRLNERGFNQTERIFRNWVRQKNLLWLDNCLIRQRATMPQWQLNLAARRANIKGAFSVTCPECVQGKHILLVDDIVTTGITMNECARVLKRAGAVQVRALALASGA
ncbi:MAG: ComF family protein [Veillonellales bacterium]